MPILTACMLCVDFMMRAPAACASALGDFECGRWTDRTSSKPESFALIIQSLCTSCQIS
ncbi:hypothetical protein K491DRAFT_621208 [Lophiostoma macrostomum CBS 122681]|uniref:Secreted protein n=1 Tax=Lophiostoma macrostomum CBS 122681 TaxID=1314788 RepID=A0A6A6TMW2_9PLEO|nr:hypothetical protein K491DRAFT_621208 [Lophiostoma macrostomum CBS 122681]